MSWDGRNVLNFVRFSNSRRAATMATWRCKGLARLTKLRRDETIKLKAEMWMRRW
jgi:hypothetical protein